MSKQGCGKCRHWVCVAPMRYENGYYGTCTISKKETREDSGKICNAFELVNIDDAEDEIERLENLIACIKRTLKSDSEKYSWEVAGVNALRLIELNMEGGEDDSK